MKTSRSSGWIREALLVVGYGLVFCAAFQTAHLFWYLPAGVRLAALLLSPYRRWPWLFVAQELSLALTEPVAAIIADVPSAILVFATASIGALWLQRGKWLDDAGQFAAMTRLICVMALVAIGATLAHLNESFPDITASFLLVRLQMVLGDYIGMLALVPLLLMLVRARPDSAMLKRWRFDVPVVLLPLLAVYLVLDARANTSQVFFFSTLLAFVPSIYFAVRSGWRGVVLALFGTSVVVALSGALFGNANLTIQAQGILAIAGSATLLLGTARDALTRSQQQLQGRNERLAAASARQDRLAAELRDVARRNLDMAEQVRRWITSELHDEIGQNLTAVQTRVRLLERKAGAEGTELARDITTTLMRMRQTVSGLMSSLRPAGLDDFGLAFALQEGAIPGTVEAAGLVYDLCIDDTNGCIEHLDGNAQTALYRFVQEAATNTIRHADATHLCVRLRASDEVNATRVLLTIADDGQGFDTHQRAAGIGLTGVRDRVLALGGRLRLHSGEFGTRLQVRVRFPKG